MPVNFLGKNNYNVDKYPLSQTFADANSTATILNRPKKDITVANSSKSPITIKYFGLWQAGNVILQNPHVLLKIPQIRAYSPLLPPLIMCERIAKI